MSRYQWPLAPGEELDDEPGGRVDFLRRHRAEFDLPGAMAVARRGAGPEPGVGRARAPASGRTHLWQPLGPDTVVEGQAIGQTRVAGRINMLAVHPDGERVYAASANGGVWYSSDGGLNWRSLGGLASTPTPGDVNRPAQRQACGAIAVAWGATEAADVVYVGTGETTHPYQAQPGSSSLGGIGILRSEHPATTAGPDPWVREAPHLLGRGVCRIALQPGGSGVVAATTIGLFERPSGAVAESAWTRVAGTPFATLQAKCADVLWTRGDGATRPERLWVWVQHGAQAGLWVRAAGQTDFTRVIAPPQALPARAVLAAADPALSPDQIYVFGDDGGNGAPRLFRVACASAATPVATRVSGVPDVLGTQGFYDIALAIHPAQKDHVVLGGSTFPAVTPSGTTLLNSGNVEDAAIVAADVAVNGAGTLTFGHPAAPKMIGAGVHADVHDLVYAKGGARLWTACDGGVYRSDRPDRMVGFAAMNDALGVVEANYIACHPVCEGRVVAGLQDNGMISHRSGAVWNHDSGGDGGGVAFDPTDLTRYLRQYFRGRWGSSDGTLKLVPALAAGENTRDYCAFYSTPAATPKHRPGAPAGKQDVTQVLIGTSRVWYTEDFGKNWVTLPGGSAPPAGNIDHDSFGQKITVCRWQSADVAWVLGEGRLMRFARDRGSDTAAGPGTWTAEVIVEKGVKPKKDTTSTDGPIRAAEVWTDIAVNLDPPAAPGQPPTMRGTRGALYLGTIGSAANTEVDTLWWFDGTSRWYATGLRRDGVPAPVTAIVCDPAFPDEVYVGTTIGVWKGVRTQVGDAAPAWTWHARLNGLPEAALEDLAIFSREDGLRLLRAGIASRGVWELRLDVPDVADSVYLRGARRRPAAQVARGGRADRRPHAAVLARQPGRAAAARPADLSGTGDVALGLGQSRRRCRTAAPVPERAARAHRRSPRARHRPVGRLVQRGDARPRRADGRAGHRAAGRGILEPEHAGAACHG